MKISLLIDMKMPTIVETGWWENIPHAAIVGIFIFISREIFMLMQLCLACKKLQLLVI